MNDIQIPTKVIPGKSPGPHLLISGGVHGDEFEPMAAIRQLMRQIDAGALRGRLTLVPVVNDSAYRRQHRCGDDGLDLARVFPGRVDGSVTERTAWVFTPLIEQADYYIDLHTGGTTLAVSPMAGYTLHNDAEVLAKQRRMGRAFNLPIVWGTSPTLDGRSMSVARDANVPAIYAEYMGSATCDPQGVTSYVEGCLNVMAELEMLERPSTPSRVVHVVEDNRPNAGYMQIQNQAPIDGYFDAHVSLGQQVQVGDRLGVVCDELGEQSREVISEQAGVILAVRTFPRVNQGDGLAVVLDLAFAVASS